MKGKQRAGEVCWEVWGGMGVRWVYLGGMGILGMFGTTVAPPPGLTAPPPGWWRQEKHRSRPPTGRPQRGRGNSTPTGLTAPPPGCYIHELSEVFQVCEFVLPLKVHKPQPTNTSNFKSCPLHFKGCPKRTAPAQTHQNETHDIPEQQ